MREGDVLRGGGEAKEGCDGEEVGFGLARVGWVEGQDVVGGGEVVLEGGEANGRGWRQRSLICVSPGAPWGGGRIRDGEEGEGRECGQGFGVLREGGEEIGVRVGAEVVDEGVSAGDRVDVGSSVEDGGDREPSLEAEGGECLERRGRVKGVGGEGGGWEEELCGWNVGRVEGGRRCRSLIACGDKGEGGEDGEGGWKLLGQERERAQNVGGCLGGDGRGVGGCVWNVDLGNVGQGSLWCWSWQVEDLGQSPSQSQDLGRGVGWECGWSGERRGEGRGRDGGLG